MLRFAETKGALSTQVELVERIENATRRRFDPQSRRAAQAMLMTAIVLQNLGKHELALKKSEEALQIVTKLSRGPLITGALNVVANNHYYLGQLDLAREMYELMLSHCAPGSAEYALHTLQLVEFLIDCVLLVTSLQRTISAIFWRRRASQTRRRLCMHAR